MLSPDTSMFNFSSFAELYPQKGRASRRHHLTYMRFETAAEAIRFAVEDLHPELLAGAILEVDEQRFDCASIRSLYASVDFPLRKGKEVRDA